MDSIHQLEFSEVAVTNRVLPSELRSVLRCALRCALPSALRFKGSVHGSQRDFSIVRLINSALLVICVSLSFTYTANASVVKGSNGTESNTTDTESHDDNCTEVIYDGPCDETGQPGDTGEPGNGNGTDGTTIVVASQPSSRIGNPINLISGNKYQSEIDYNSPASRLQFYRHYNSSNAGINNGLGQGWTTTLGASIRKSESGGYVVVQGNGSLITFRNIDEDADGEPIFRGANPSSGYITGDEKNLEWHIPDGRKIRFFGSFLVQIDFPGNSLLKLKYRNKKVIEVSDEAGRVMLVDYYPATALPSYDQGDYASQPGYLASITLPNGQTRKYFYDKEHNLSRVQYSDGTNRTYHYENVDFPNHLTGITNRNAIRYATWSYNDFGKGATSEHADGVEKVSIEYFPVDPDTGLGTTKLTNSLDQISTYHWQKFPEDGQSLLVSTEGPGCSTCPVPNMRYTYNSFYQMVTATRVNADIEADLLAFDNNDQQLTGYKQTEFVYDEMGRLTEKHKVGANGSTRLAMRREYSDNTTLPSKIIKPSVNPDGDHETNIEYTAERLVKRITERGYAPTDESRTLFNALERTTTLTYKNGLVSTIDGPRTDVDDFTNFSYDELDRLTVVELPTGGRISMGLFDTEGRPTEFQINQQSPLTLAYDLNGNVVEVSMRKETIRYQYDAESQLESITDPFGKTSTFNYDQAGRMTRVTDDMGLSVEYLKDTENRLTGKSYVGLNGNLIRSMNYVFDAENRLHESNEQSSNQSTGHSLFSTRAIEYDQLDQLVSVHNDNGGSVDLVYDGFGRISSVSESGVVQAEIEYDAKGQQISQTDARGNRTETVVDDFGRVIALMSPDTGISRYQYDNAGNRVKLENGNGEVTEYVWDAGNRLTKVTSIDGVTSYEFHPINGRLTKTSNPDSTETFEYNPYAQLVKHSREINGQIFSTSVIYNDRGQVEKKLLPDGQAIRYHYHQDGVNVGTLRAITREKALGLMQDTLVGEIDLERRDGSAGYLSHNGIRTQREFHPDGSIKSIEVSDTLSLQYTFDDEGNISGIDEDSISQSYSYEGRKLVYANTRVGDFAYAYDETSNRIASLSVDKNGVETELDYSYGEEGEGNRLLATKDVNSETVNNYEYDEAGAALKAGSEFSYVYNTKHRPIEVYKAGELVAEYRYNSFGERVWKTVYTDGVGASTYFLYDGNTMVAEINDNNRVQSHYLYLQGRHPVVKLEGKQVYAIHTDQIGTPRRLTNDKAELVWDADYTPFGKATVTVAKVDMNLRFPGQYEDTETGTHYNYFRDYDPGTGRYITSDPIGLQGGVNTYAYASANPLLSTDVLGLEDEVNDGNVMDKVREWVAKEGGESIEAGIKFALGENFMAVAAQTLTQIPGEFEKLKATGDYPTLDIGAIKPLFTKSAAVDMAYTFALILAMKKGADLAGKAGGFGGWIAKELLKKIIAFGIRAYFVKEFGEAAGQFYDRLDLLGEQIEDLARNEDGFSCSDTEEIAAEIARILADIAIAAPGNLVNFFNRVKIPRGKGTSDKDKCKGTETVKPSTSNKYLECFENIKGFGSLKSKHSISADDIERLRVALGVSAITRCKGTK